MASAEWKSLQITVPIKPLLEPVVGILETLMIYLEVLKAILETIKAFLVDFGNPLKALILALIQLIQQLFKAIQQTGLYTYYDIPDPREIDYKPNYDRFSNVAQPFTYRLSGSWYDSQDMNRPQPVKLFNQGMYLLFVVDASSIVKMARLIKMLLRFFGKEFLQARYLAPRNVKALPIGSNKDPILAVAKLFGADSKGIAVEWSLPTTQRNPDPGIADTVGELADEFIPPNFLIEKSSKQPNKEMDTSIDLSENLTDEVNSGVLAAVFEEQDSAGLLTYLRPTGIEIPQSGGTQTTIKTRLFDNNGEPVQKFEKYVVVGAGNILDVLQMSLGKFRWIDNDVQQDVTYYYRVRAFSGDLDYVKDPAGYAVIKPQFSTVMDLATMQWSAPDGKDDPTMGRASPIVQARLPKLPAKFDVIDNLYRLFLVAFSLDFAEQVSIVRNSTGEVTRPKFDSDGVPVPGTGTVPSDIGKGSLSGLGSVINGGYSASTVVQLLQPGLTAAFESFRMPWQVTLLKYQAQRLAYTAASALLAAGSGAIDKFKDLMQGDPMPWGPLEGIEGTLKDVTTLEIMCLRLTVDPADGVVPQATKDTYKKAYNNVSVRGNVQEGIIFIKPFFMGGAPPDWSSIRLFDMLPWVPTILYKLLDTINALLDAYKGVIDEIKDFIDLIIRKINALEKFIQFLINLIESIMNLSVSCYFLNSGVLTGGIDEWDATLWNAGGDAPPYVFGGYSAGIALAAVAPDVSAITSAFSILFGG